LGRVYRYLMEVLTLDYHTAGEPLRIVTSGLPEISGETMLDKRRFMQQELDHYRRFLMLEPRGHADMYGAVLTGPVTPDGDIGVLFLHNEGYSTMCGHGIIALVTAGLEHGLFEAAAAPLVRIDTPAGRITATAHYDSGGRIDSVSFLNVPSFVMHEQHTVEVEGGPVDCTIAFGGAFYAYVDAETFGLELAPGEAARMIDLGRKIKERVNRDEIVRHPAGEPDLNFLYGTIFVRQGSEPGHSRNACVFADGELDRSPTGTGVSGRAAIEFHAGRLKPGEVLKIDSFIGTRFEVHYQEVVEVAGIRAIIPEVRGSAHVCGEHRFVLDPRDPLADGFLVR
jgi:trans-L-3-hydroxyproline dehydratase